MSEAIAGTHVRMRVLKRFSHYNAGELIAVEFYAARELAAKRLAQPLDLLVPTSRTEPEPQRQPAGIVRK